VPLLRSADEARALVQAAKFPPWGRRGFGSPYSPASFGITSTEYLQQANHSLLTIVQIETKEALDTVDEIAAVDGIDALFIGPVDLGMSSSLWPIISIPPVIADSIIKVTTSASLF
jgi:4-hydroxy-2-oxoheptanedioate aldolase